MVTSDADEELLFNIPFTGNIKLKGLIIMGGQQGFHPSKVKLYKNRPHMTFDDAQSKCDQEFELVQDTDGVVEYATKVVTFSSGRAGIFFFWTTVEKNDEHGMKDNEILVSTVCIIFFYSSPKKFFIMDTF